MKKLKKKVMVFGTFDGLHPGHLNLFKQARELSENVCLVVSVARDINVVRIKGRRPEFNEKERAHMIKRSGLADEVVLSGLAKHLPHILKVKPDIIALGYDQKVYVKNLKQDLKKLGLSVRIIRLKAYKPRIYKNKLLKKSNLNISFANT